MRKVRLLLSIVCATMLFGTVCHAEDSYNWYIKKRGNLVPQFPENADIVSEYGGIYVDKTSSDTGEKKIYLTFDAGYENGNIEKILDIMREEHVHGAFFILSNLIDKNPELVKRMVNEGHLVCNHTSTHRNMTTLSNEAMLSDMGRLEAKYKDLTGKDMEKIFRFPEGRYSMRTLKLLNDNGYKTVFWSMAYDDWDNSRQMDAKVAREKLLTTTHDGAILLLHPTSTTNAAILRELIVEWKSMGYTFGSLKDI